MNCYRLAFLHINLIFAKKVSARITKKKFKLNFLDEILPQVPWIGYGTIQFVYSLVIHSFVSRQNRQFDPSAR